MEPTAPLTRPRDVPPPSGGDRRPWAAIVLGVMAVLLALVVIVLLAGDDDEDEVGTDTTTTAEQTTTTSDDSTTSEAPATTETTTTAVRSITDQEAAGVVWPDPGSATAYDTASSAVAGFAEELLGFAAPVYGELMEGDSRSGEMEVRPTADGPATLVAVRQMSDDRWYVLFAASSEVELRTPTAGSAVDHPLEVAGLARSFEGEVRVAVYERGAVEPLGESFVTAGSGEERAPFAATVDWPVRGTGGWGVVVASTASGADGSTWAATAIPVGLVGGD